MEGRAQYDLRHKVILKTEKFPRFAGKPLVVKLLPGGRYLSAFLDHQGIRLYDLHRKNTCVWAKSSKVISAAFELRKDGSIIVFLVNRIQRNEQYVYIPLLLYGFCRS